MCLRPISGATIRGADDSCRFWFLPPKVIHKNNASRPTLRREALLYAGIAQLVEQLICNQKVSGSIPFTGTNAGGPYVIQAAAELRKSE